MIHTVHGILVQLPLPPQFDIKMVVSAISRQKDVDGFHLNNVGGLVIGETVFPPCTPYGVMRLLNHAGVEVAGRNAVVVGASNVVGKPMALMLIQRHATASVCHAKARDLAQFTILDDILVAAAGCPNLIVGPMVKTGAFVIDVGISRLPCGRLVGDCDFQSVSRRASKITPMPGGVGPMTVTMLLVNTIQSAEIALPQAATITGNYRQHLPRIPLRRRSEVHRASRNINAASQCSLARSVLLQTCAEVSRS